MGLDGKEKCYWASNFQISVQNATSQNFGSSITLLFLTQTIDKLRHFLFVLLRGIKIYEEKSIWLILYFHSNASEIN